MVNGETFTFNWSETLISSRFWLDARLLKLYGPIIGVRIDPVVENLEVAMYFKDEEYGWSIVYEKRSFPYTPPFVY